MSRHDMGQGFHINSLHVKNFRSIQDVNLDIGSLTVLVGPNASGKSSLMDALRFVSNAFRWNLERAISYRNGIGAISRRRMDADELDFEIRICAEIRDHCIEYSFRIVGEDSGSFMVDEESCKVSGIDGSMDPIEFCIREGSMESPEWLLTELSKMGSDALNHIGTDNLNLFYILRIVIFLYDIRESAYNNQEDARVLYELFDELETHFRNMRFYNIFPDAIRDPQKMMDPHPLQEDGSNIGSVLRDISINHFRNMNRLRGSLDAMIHGITDLRVNPVGKYLVTELAHSDWPQNGLSNWFDISQESDGTLRLLAMLAAMNQRPSLPLIGIEEPELAIHPGALIALAEDIEEASRVSQIVLSTHSAELIDQFSINDIRAVEMVNGITEAGNVSESQRNAIKERLFSPGELHQMEGLRFHPPR